MTGIQNKKPYDLDEQTFNFAERAFKYFNNLPGTFSNIEIAKQGIRAAGSVGANYIEADEAFSKKDFVMRIKISRKESKEEIYWLKLSKPKPDQYGERGWLIQEATELMKIFGAIITKLK